MLRRTSLLSLVAGLLVSFGLTSTPAHAVARFAAPQNVHGVISTDTRLQIAWDAVDQAPGYRVHYSTSSTFASDLHGLSTTSTTVVFASLKPNTVYYFRVAVVDGTNLLSDWSSTASYRTKSLFKLAVMSYNVHDPDQDGVGDWSIRCPRVADAIVANAPHVLGLQEIYDNTAQNGDPADRDSFLRCLNDKVPGQYAMTPVPTDTGGDENGYDSRIIYKPAALRLITSNAFVYTAQVTKDTGVREKRQLTWAKFYDIASGRYVLFTTTHLTPRSDSVDVSQWKQLISYVNQLRSSTVPGGWIVIVTGDFNVTKFEAPASSQLSSMRINGYDDVLGQIYRSYSTYRNPTTRVDSWIGTSNQGLRDVRANGGSVAPGKNSNSIDYVFVSHALKAPFYRVYAQPRTGYIMNYLASDHFPVRATISQ